MSRESIVPNSLGEREKEVLYLAGKGLTTKQIAETTDTSPWTVKNQFAVVILKLQEAGLITEEERYQTGRIRSTVAIAAKIAAENGLIPPLPLDRQDYLDFFERHVASKNMRNE